MTAGLVQVDFWDAEDGYYLNGTYYGDKNLLAIGAAGLIRGVPLDPARVPYRLDPETGEIGVMRESPLWPLPIIQAPKAFDMFCKKSP